MRIEHCKKSWITAALLAALGAGVAQQAWADDNPYLFGDWNGNRTRLADAGVTFDFGYTGEAAHNFAGGATQLTRYTDQWKFGAKLDLEKLWGWSGVTFQIVMSDRNGRDLGADAGIGNNQLIQEVYGRGQTWHLTIFALDKKFLDGHLDWRVGRLPVGEDFASFSCDFQNLTFCGAQPGNIVGDYWVNWPTSQWATRLKFNPNDRAYVQIGVYQVNPKYIDDHYARHSGWKLDFPSGITGALIPLELGWTPVVDGRPGSYKLGVWYNTSSGADLFLDRQLQPRAISDGQPLQRDSRRGVYINLQQQVSGAAGSSGATLFLNVSQADHATSAPTGKSPSGWNMPTCLGGRRTRSD